MEIGNIIDSKYYSVAQISKLLLINLATARYKVNKIPKEDQYIINMNKYGKIRILRVSGLAIKKFILGLS